MTSKTFGVIATAEGSASGWNRKRTRQSDVGPDRGRQLEIKGNGITAIGSLLGWVAAGVPIIMAENHEHPGRYVSRLLFTAARRRWRELRTLAAAVGTTADSQAGEPVRAP